MPLPLLKVEEWLLSRNLCVHKKKSRATVTHQEQYFLKSILCVSAEMSDEIDASPVAESIAYDSSLLTYVYMDPEDAKAALKGSKEEYKMSMGDVVMLNFNPDYLTKDIEEITFKVDGTGELQLYLYDTNVKSLLAVSTFTANPLHIYLFPTLHSLHGR